MHLLGSDGTQEAYRRIRRGDYQAATIPEPIDLFGWQAVDELNRAFHHQSWSHFMPAIHIVDRSNIDREGGTLNQYIPGNNYRTWYLHIWGKQMAPGR
jgi:ribose transport system substrate-binding protein